MNISTRKELRLAPGDPRNNPLLREIFPMPNPEAQRSLGSGVIVSKEGYLLTNYHVVSQYALEPERYRLRFATTDGLEGPAPTDQPGVLDHEHFTIVRRLHDREAR